MVFNATFNNISVISWRSVLLVEQTGENHRPVASHWQIVSHNVVWSTLRHERGSKSPEYSCGKRNPLYPMRAVSFVSIVLYLIFVERSRWKLFQKRVVHSKLNIYVFIVDITIFRSIPYLDQYLSFRIF